MSRTDTVAAPARLPHTRRGFSLIEIAVGLLIVTLVLGAMLVPLTTQVAQRNTSDTQKTLEDIKEALIGYAIVNGRLPCPAAPNATGVEVPTGGGACTNQYNGYVPAATLGLQATDNQGYAIDAWGNRIRYAVTKASWIGSVPQYDFTTSNGMRSRGMAALTPNLDVCSTSTGITTSDCGTATYLTNSAVAVILSPGPNANTGGGTGADEAANLDNDQVFVSHTRSAAGAPNGEFDDIVSWLSGNVLISRMVSAGQLP